MRIGDGPARALKLLAQLPFLDRGELDAVAGWSDGDSLDAVSYLKEREWLTEVQHSTRLISSTYRFYLNAAGVHALSSHAGVDIEKTLRTHRVSREWRDILLGRLDGLAMIYRLIRAVSRTSAPEEVRLYRSHPLDATIVLPDGVTLGVIRQGRTTSNSAFTKRLHRLFKEPLPSGLLIVASDPVRLRHLGNVGPLRYTSVPVYLTLEENAAVAGPKCPVWRPLEHSGHLSLDQAMSEPMPAGPVPDEKEAKLASLPDELPTGDIDEHLGEHCPIQLLPVTLEPREKEVMDTLAEWSWLSSADLRGLMNIRTTPRLSQLTRRLRALGLLHVSRAGGRVRLNLSDRGFGPLALRDRTSHRDLKKRLSVEARKPKAGRNWENVSGSVSRQLLRHLTHTEAVHRFVAALASGARSQGITVIQLDPPSRASRYFRDGSTGRSVLPDAFSLLGRADRKCALFLEYERRSVHASTMPDKLGPYLAYYSTSGPEDDHDVIPLILFVFETEAKARRFLDVARRKVRETGTHLPLWVCSDDLLYPGGPLRPVWRSPHRDEPGSPVNDALSP